MDFLAPRGTFWADSDGVIDDNTAPTKDGSIRLDAEAFNSGDAETLGLLCPVSDDTLLYVAGQ